MRITFRYLFVMTVLVTSCSEPASTIQPLSKMEQTEQDSVLVQLGRLNRTIMDQAFAQLSYYAYQRTTHTEQLAPTQAKQTDTVQFTDADRSAERLTHDTAGTFDTSFWHKNTHPLEENALNVGRLLLPNQPAYLSPRGRELYRYQMLPDTTIDDIRLRRLKVQILSEAGDKQPIQQVRLYLDAQSSALIGLDVERRHTSMLFTERSRFNLKLQKVGAIWVPATVYSNVQTQTLFFDPIHIRRHTTYQDFRQLN